MSARTDAHLVLSSGGVRCLAYIGALEQLQRSTTFATVSTCSAGTLIGALLCSGISPQVMREEAMALDLRRLAGPLTFKGIRQVTRRGSWPFALYPTPTIDEVLSEILVRHGRDGDPRMGDLQPELATAAVDLVNARLMVYTSATHPEMRVREVLRIASAVPAMFPPYRPSAPGSMEVVDAAVATTSPVWLATGLGDRRHVVVLRVPEPVVGRPMPGFFPKWIAAVVQRASASQDAYVLERSARITVHDIESHVGVFDFKLTRAQKHELIEAGARTVAAHDERRADQRSVPQADEPGRARALVRRPDPLDRDGLAQLEGTWRQRSHVAAAASQPPDTVFISYAREDRPFVERLRRQLSDLVEDPGVTVWDDSYIESGAVWEERIVDAILRARVAVLLVSSSFNASRYIQETELPLLRRSGTPLQWISLDGSSPGAEESRRNGHGPIGRTPRVLLSDREADAALGAAAAAIRGALTAM